MRVTLRYLVVGIAAMAGGQARAEAVRMTGTFVAEARAVAMQRSIAVGRFDGRDGAAFALALERALAGEGGAAPYFELIATGRGRADAVVDGAVSTGVQDSEWTRTERKCVERDAADKCVRKDDVRIPCRRRTVDLSVDVRVAGDRLLYSGERSRRD